MVASPEALFAELVASAPSRPFVTYYNEDSGERTELSVRSLANWVAKTHFLLTDELGLAVGDSAYLDVAADWISVPILLGCWTAGLHIVSTPAGVDVAFAPGPVDGVPDVYATTPGSLTRSFGANVPPGVADYVASVRPQADAWTAVHPPATPTDPALDGTSRADLVAVAQARAGALGLDRGARIATARDWRNPDDWIDTLLAPLAVGGSLVLLRGAAPDVLRRRVEQERATLV